MRICSVEGCERQHEARGFCKVHYRQYKKYGKIIRVGINLPFIAKICKVEGCESKYYAMGYCHKHYAQIKQYGKIFDRTVFDKNEIVFKKNVAEVVLYNVKHNEVGRAIIDKEDIEKVKKHKWYLDNFGYAATRINNRIIKIQHIVLAVESNMRIVVDHKDRNPLNNRKTNLRLCKNSENLRNRTKTKKNKSGYKGVVSVWKKWEASIRVDGKIIHLGAFRDKIDAAKAYNKAAIKYHGEFACLNII